MEDTNQTSILGLLQTLWQRRKVFFWVLPITFVLSAALILGVPRYYRCEVVLAPETKSVSSSSSLLALASSFGFDINSMSNQDALYPTLYPMMVESPNFLITLFDTHVTTADGSYEGTYYNYLLSQYKVPFWTQWKNRIRSLFPQKTQEIKVKTVSNEGANVFNLSMAQWRVIGLMQDDILCSVDHKTSVITFSVTAQDKMVCAIMADSVCAALQTFMTDYRTIKNRTDIVYYEKVMHDAYEDYQQASERYVRYMDSHKDMNLEQHRIVAQNLDNEMQLKYSAYSSFQKQFLATQARLQENTPVFTVLKSASIPLMPAGPRRMMFVLIMLILATCITSGIVCRQQLIQIITSNNN